MPDTGNQQPLLYSTYAEWWPLLSAPEEYIEESKLYTDLILAHCKTKPRTLLEMGSGGGHNAVHMKSTFQITLVDLSSEMLSVSRKLNPECTHIQGDMRTIVIGKEFDAVFIHDAISHMTTVEDLGKAIANAYRHCTSGGAALFCPDFTVETFKPSTGTGGSDSGEKGLRYLEWIMPDEAESNTYSVYMIYLFRDGKNVTRSEVDRLHCARFKKNVWIELMTEVGFKAKAVSVPFDGTAAGNRYLFIGQK